MSYYTNNLTNSYSEYSDYEDDVNRDLFGDYQPKRELRRNLSAYSDQEMNIVTANDQNEINDVYMLNDYMQSHQDFHYEESEEQMQNEVHYSIDDDCRQNHIIDLTVSTHIDSYETTQPQEYTEQTEFFATVCQEEENDRETIDVQDKTPEKKRASKNPQDKRITADPLLKAVLRAFRQEVKELFKKKYGSNYFQKNRTKHYKKYDKDLMTETIEDGGFGMSEETYISQKLIIEDLLYGTKTTVVNDNIELCNDMKDMFCHKPNQKNLSRFFSNQAIQALWWSPKWYESQKLHQILAQSNPIMRQKLQNLFDKISPCGLSIIP